MAAFERNLVNFVCTANICRSPIAEYLFRRELEARAKKDARWRRLTAISSGVSAVEGMPISLNSKTVLAAEGIDASAHVSQPLTQELADRSLALFCMTSAHKLLTEMRLKNVDGRVHLLRDFMRGKVSREIPDPYGSGLADYAACKDEIAAALPSVFDFLEKQFD